LTTG